MHTIVDLNFRIITSSSQFFSIAQAVKICALGIKYRWHKICTQPRCEAIKRQRSVKGLSVSSPSSWVFGCLRPKLICSAAVQPWIRTVRSLSGGSPLFSQEVLLRWDSCPWSLLKPHGSSTLPCTNNPDVDLLSWLPGLSSDLIHHFGLVQWSGLLDEPDYTHP